MQNYQKDSEYKPKKLLILNILEILRKYTDENHRLGQKEIIDILKKEYGAKAALVLHENGLKIKEYDNWQELVDSIDVWGYRSLSIKNDFENYFGPHNRSFRCCSGIPKSYINDTLKRNWHLRNRYVYVGYLLKRKFADVAINAVADSYGKSPYGKHLRRVVGGKILY